MGEFPTDAQIERRQYPRAKAALIGRYMLENRHERLCTVIEASSSGLALVRARARQGRRNCDCLHRPNGEDRRPHRAPF